MSNETKLAEMLCTRLCHDLTGPIGAVNNGAEFLNDEGFEMQHEALDLILTSAAEAVHRLQYYRQAYGRVNDHGEACLAEKKQVVEDYFSTTKINIDWPDTATDASGISISTRMSRLILNLLIIVSGAMIKGGRISVNLEANEARKLVTLKGQGEIIKMEPELVQVLRGEAEITQLSPKTAQLMLTMSLAEQVGATINVEIVQDRITVTAEQKHMAMAHLG